MKIVESMIFLKEMNGPVAVGRNEVEATMDAVVNDGLAVQSALVLEIFLELHVNVVGQHLRRLLRVQRIAETYFFYERKIPKMKIRGKMFRGREIAVIYLEKSHLVKLMGKSFEKSTKFEIFF
jgi:hypothetical protein